jgi:hypothetical protein
VTDVTLHFKAQLASRECAVCGTRLDRSERDHWWLRNTWTSSVRDYAEGGGCLPTDWFRPCGKLSADLGETPNVRLHRTETARTPTKEV